MRLYTLAVAQWSMWGANRGRDKKKIIDQDRIIFNCRWQFQEITSLECKSFIFYQSIKSKVLLFNCKKRSLQLSGVIQIQKLQRGILQICYFNKNINFITNQMNDFLSRVQKQMIMLRKKNLNLINEFKIEMFQGRKNLHKEIINKQFGIDQDIYSNKQTFQTAATKKRSMNKNKSSNLMLNIECENNKSGFQKDSNRFVSFQYSTNPNSQFYPTQESRTQIKQYQIQIYGAQNKENECPNFRMTTDVSAKDHNDSRIRLSDNENCEQFDLNGLKNDQSMVINTEEVKKKYLKFVSPSAGWTVSAEPKRQMETKTVNGQLHPLCTQFVHDPEYFDSQGNEQTKKDQDSFGFQDIDERHFSKQNTIQQLVQAEDFVDSVRW